MKKKKYGVLVCALFLLLGCSKQVCTVGSTQISEKDVALRAKVSEIYYPGSGKKHVGLAQLIKANLAFEIIKSLGSNVDGALLDREAKRIDDNTKARDVLQKIKAVYGDNRSLYIESFVRPVYAERFLYNEIFLTSKEIHKERYLKAKKFLESTRRNSKSFKELAEKNSIETARLRISPEKGIAPYGAKEELKSPGENAEQTKKLTEALLTIRQGQIYPEIIEWQEGYQVIRFDKKEGRDFIIESAVIPKRNYDDWFWEKASTIPVKIYDENLKNELLKEVSWARHLKL